ncbi:hypothetical protein Tsubulata_010144 [Turnera subulata]|uniref:Pentatricopeptide repeat-containing protein n=1 Tax=Turnera subulata TaxID=218843 RepID=A0A9Q0FMC1_9ROSI|nr:hypothetical protein Tsubulata_010144 [Turnera subulata]
MTGLFKDMVLEAEVRPNEYILAIVLKSCSDSGRVREGRQCHGYVLKSGLLFHEYVGNALVHLYSKCSDMEEAIRVRDSVSGEGVVACNSILSGLVERGNVREGVKESWKWDEVTYVSVLGLCACLKDRKLGLQIHGKMLTGNVECDAYAWSGIISMYGKCGDPSSARRVFDGVATLKQQIKCLKT